MTVNKEFSVVADSTCSCDSPKMSDDPDTSLIYPSSSSASRDSTYRTGPPDLDEQVPPSSDIFQSFPNNELTDDENEDSSQDASRKDLFGLKKMLQDIDARYDSDGEMPTISGIPISERPSATQPFFPQRAPSAHIPTSLVVAPSNALTKDVFGGSLSTLTASPLSQSAFVKAVSPSILQPRRHLKKRVVHDSDSESELADNKGSPATTSPAFPHAINTPKSRSSPTPPTSDDDEMRKHDSKGKGKVVTAASRSTVVSLQFSEDPNGPSVASKKSVHKDNQNKKSKIKRPTKRDIKETRREGARLAADQLVSIPRTENSTQKYTFQNFFTALAAGGRPIGKEPSSDPIGEFSSPPKDALLVINRHTVASTPTLFVDASPFRLMHKTEPRSSLLEPMASLGDLDSDSDALPEVGELVSEEQKKRDQAHMLLEKKKLLLAQQANKPDVSEDDDDLEIVPASEMQVAVKEEEAERKSGKKKRISEGRKRQLNLGGIGLERQRAKATPLKDEASSFVSSSVGKLKGKKASAIMTQDELNKSLVQRVVSVNRELTKQKEEEWVRRGGKVIDGAEGASSSTNDASTAYAEKGLQAAREQGIGMEVDGDEDEGSDEDWTPEMRGSASPSPQPNDDEEGDEENQAIEEDQEADVTMVNPESDVLATDDDFEEKQVLNVRPRRRAQAIVDSDSDGEKDENTFPIPKSTPRTFGSPQNYNNENTTLSIPISSMSHRGSLSSTDERTEDENDKENNTSLMFDRSEDKENKAVVRHGDTGAKHLLGTRTSSLFSLEHEIARGLSMSPVMQSRGIDADDEDDENEDDRLPLKDLYDDDPFDSQVTSSKPPASFAARLQQASPAATFPPISNLATFIEDDSGSPQSPQVPSVFGAEPLQPGFSDLFESGTEKQISTPFKRPAGGLSLSESFSGEPPPILNKLRKPAALDLTQDIALQPAFQIGSGLLRKADQIFEKEQGYLLEAAGKKLQREPTLYVNDHGFLTQNRPDGASPRIYRPPSPSQPSTLINDLHSQSIERLPLRTPLQTLSLSQSIDFDSSDDTTLRRLRRAVSPPSRTADIGYRSSPSASPSPQKRIPNAFEVMAGTAKARSEKVKRRLEKSEFVEAEAQESDDDEMFGLGGRKKDDGEEEDGEDLDMTLETLVDDQEMDEATVNAQLVQEKYQEHAEQDDREIQRLHQAAIQGDLRKKKRNHGVGMDDSDDDSDDDEKNRRIRRGMHKKPKIDRDNIKDLASLDETRPFYQVYEHGLVNDDEFAFLEQSQGLQDAVMGDEHQVEGTNEYVTPAEVRQLARELAEQEEDEEPVDLHDVSWIDLDASDGEGSVRVKPVEMYPRKQARSGRRGIDNANFDSGLDQAPKPVTMPEKSMARMQSWANTEWRSRNAGTTGRSVGGAAVTGHGKAKVKTGGGSLRNSSTVSAASTDSSRARRPAKAVKAAPSLLADVAADRSTRFS